MKFRIPLLMICLLGLALVGCDRSVDPGKDDVIVGTAKVEHIICPTSLEYCNSSFSVRIEERTLVYTEGSTDGHQNSVTQLQDGDMIRIVRRGQKYYWTTGNKLVPFK